MPIKDLWVGGTASAAPGGVPLRVVSVNVLSQNRTPEKVLEFVRGADADLVVLVDAKLQHWSRVLAALADLYPYRAPQTWRERPPVILFSRHPIISDKVMEAPRSRRPYLLAEVAVGDRKLVIAGVHPSSPSPSEARDTRRRNRELDNIAEVASEADRPLIVAGDFNTSRGRPRFGICSTGRACATPATARDTSAPGRRGSGRR